MTDNGILVLLFCLSALMGGGAFVLALEARHRVRSLWWWIGLGIFAVAGLAAVCNAILYISAASLGGLYGADGSSNMLLAVVAFVVSFVGALVMSKGESDTRRSEKGSSGAEWAIALLLLVALIVGVVVWLQASQCNVDIAGLCLRW